MLTQPGGETVRVVLVDSAWPEVSVESAYHLLSPSDQAQADRLHSPANRARCIVSKFVRKPVLADALGVSISELELDVEARGKPFIKKPDTQYCFNVSDTKDRIAIAIASGCRVGVDIEKKSRKIKDLDAFSEMILSQTEKMTFARCDEANRGDFLLRTWVLKEALTKALGAGLHQTFSGIAVDLSARFGRALVSLEANAVNHRVFLGLREVSGYYMGICLLDVCVDTVSCAIQCLSHESFVDFLSAFRGSCNTRNKMSGIG